MNLSKTINLYPKPINSAPTREIAVSSSATAFAGVAASVAIGDEVNYITYTSVAKNAASNNTTVAYVQGTTTDTTVAVAGQAITVSIGYQALTAASLTTNMTGANNDLVFTAVEPGADGNNITVALTDPSGNDQALAITVTDTDIVVSLATGPAGAITTTASQLLAALNADEDAAALITTTLKTGNTGAGVVTALTETSLAGGYDAALVGTLADIKAAIEGDEAAAAIVTVVVSGTSSTVADPVAATNLASGQDVFPDRAYYVLVNVKTQSVYATFDGTTPSATNGVILPSGYLEYWSKQAAQDAKFIQGSGAARVTGVPFTD